jgi:hypothetical protein
MPWIALDPALAQAAPVTTAGAPLTSVGDTLLSLGTDLQSQLANRADVTSPRRAKWINRAYRHLCAMLPLPELKYSFGLTLVADQPMYLLPKTAAGWVSTGVIKQAGLADADNYPSGGIPWTFISEQQYIELPDRTDRPTAFLRYRDMAVVWPTPEDVHTAVFYSRIRPQDLVADTDSPILPPEWHEAILLAARYRALRDLREWKEAAIANNDFVAHIRVLNDNAAEEQGEQETKITPVTARIHRRRLQGISLSTNWEDD